MTYARIIVTFLIFFLTPLLCGIVFAAKKVRKIRKFDTIMATKKLTRSTDKLLAGVCGGLAEYFEIDASMMRVLYAALTIFSAAFPGVLLYIIMAIIIPQKGVASTTVEDVEAEEVKTEKKTKAKTK